CVDSDDWLPKNSIPNQVALARARTNHAKICGIAGLCVSRDKEIIGKRFPKEGLVGSKQILNQLAPGDKATIIKTEVIKQYEFPLIPAEKFLPESFIYNRMHEHGYSFSSTNE